MQVELCSIACRGWVEQFWLWRFLQAGRSIQVCLLLGLLSLLDFPGLSPPSPYLPPVSFSAPGLLGGSAQQY
jgi:hypothetical protein